MSYVERSFIYSFNPGGNFSVSRAQSGNHPVRGALSLTGNVLLWDQSTEPPIEHVPPEILSSNVVPFRWLFVGPLSDEVEAALRKLATPKLEKIMCVINTLQQDSIYGRFPVLEEKHANLRRKLQQLSQRITTRNIIELSDSVNSLGMQVSRVCEAECINSNDPRNAHDQQGANIPLKDDRPMEDLRVSAQISMSALVDVSAASHGDALNLVAAKFVHRRTRILRRTRFNSLKGLSEAYSDFFGEYTLAKNHKPTVGIADRLLHIILDSSRVFQVPKLILHMFSIRRTHESDSRSFLHDHIVSSNSIESTTRIFSDSFRSEIEREQAALHQARP